MRILNNDKFAPIAFFDSGVGGLTVLNHIKKILPYENYIYYGDTIHMPYGEKSKEELLNFSEPIFRFFERKNCKAVVMACNTTSSMIYEDVKDKYNFTIYPIVQSVAKIIAQMNINSLGVLATRGTIESNAYPNQINKYNKNMKVSGHFCPQWVHIVENNLIDLPESIEIVKSDLDEILKFNPDKIVLGCTHYPYLLNLLSNLKSRDTFIDPAQYFASFISEDLEAKNLLNDYLSAGTCEYYVSSNPKAFKSVGNLFCNIDKKPILLKFD